MNWSAVYNYYFDSFLELLTLPAAWLKSIEWYTGTYRSRYWGTNRNWVSNSSLPCLMLMDLSSQLQNCKVISHVADILYQVAILHIHCIQGINEIGCRLGNHLQCPMHQYYILPAALCRNHIFFGYQVVEQLNAELVHIQK
jgi:hypothetical protein